MIHESPMFSRERAAVLRWAASIGAVTAEALADVQGCAIASARSQLAAAERSRLLSGHRPLAAVSPLYTITRAGLRACGLHGLEPCRVSAANALHLSTCARVAAHLARAYPDRRVAGERQLRRDERARGLPLASACLRVGPDGRQMLHRPDLVLWPARPSGTVDASTSELPVAVEVELTVKAPRRLLEICRAWARCRVVDGVIYLATPGVERALARALGSVHAGTHVVVVPLSTLEDARAGLAPSTAGSGRGEPSQENRMFIRGDQTCETEASDHVQAHFNRVVLVGRLTRDPEMRALPSGVNVCSLRLACNSSRREADGTYTERPNYFDVSVYGAAGDSVGRYMVRGRRLAVDGRLEWREWETGDQQKRQAVSVVAETVQFLDGPSDRAGNGEEWDGEPGDGDGSADADARELVGVGAGGGDEEPTF